MCANTGLPYELVVQSIFQEILDQDGACTIRVEHDVELQGRTTTHQIDVLWRFEIGGIRYLTLVQAKDWDSRIKKEHVLAFRGVLDDIPGQPRGVLITRTGFQSGAGRLPKLTASDFTYYAVYCRVHDDYFGIRGGEVGFARTRPASNCLRPRSAHQIHLRRSGHVGTLSCFEEI